MAFIHEWGSTLPSSPASMKCCPVSGMTCSILLGIVCRCQKHSPLLFATNFFKVSSLSEHGSPIFSVRLDASRPQKFSCLFLSPILGGKLRPFLNGCHDLNFDPHDWLLAVHNPWIIYPVPTYISHYGLIFFCLYFIFHPLHAYLLALFSILT